ncbi:MAG: 23S rRNA (uracil(1939)-C(5))-methyltransferase RlmD [Erysipelotrichaceae bacterium]|nr:23S rRNA (uracil(1939)-C(5))-methyltransferase RlmD [Erysipelotrichaceae bacterium]MDY5251657.1 23S rRNA (uracil(1939)-C(5))-methyltransferase RlmD [Erysipelotrichaceae bacterium]
MLKVNDILEISVDKNAKARYDQQKLIVKQALPNETLKIKVEKVKKHEVEAKIIQIIKANPGRVKPKCKIYDHCGGCSLLHLDYQAQLVYKKQQLQKLTELKVHDVVASEQIWHYRNKIILGFKSVGKKIVAGLYEEDSHKIIPYDSCLLHDPLSDEIVQTICSLIAKYKISIYDEDQRTGLFRHVLIRKGHYTNEYLVVLVLSNPKFVARNQFIKELRASHPQITTIVQNINKRATSIVLQDEERVLYGKGFINDKILGHTFKISARSFFQINVLQAEQLYTKAIDLLQLQKQECLLDAYCGTGTIGICAAAKVKMVIGVEANKQAVKDAITNAKINKIQNTTFYHDDATSFIQECAKNKVKIDAIIMDPARDGSTYKFIEAIAKLNVTKIAYISCNPLTQLRDLKWFKQFGYTFKEMFLYDMFCHSNHLESIVLITKEGKKHGKDKNSKR